MLVQNFFHKNSVDLYFICIFAAESCIAMEEKRYPHIDEEQGIDMACEPVAEMAVSSASSVDGVTTVNDWIDDLDRDRLPILGPKTEEEAIARIAEAEKDFDDPTKWITSEQMWAELHQKFPWLQ